jgi:hypothetical protein
MSAERPADAVRVSGARCPFCHEEVRRGVEPAVCVACHALHHLECMAEHGACSACGASHPRFAPVERPSVVATPRPPSPEWHQLSAPRLLGRVAGLLGSGRRMLVLYALVAIVAVCTAFLARDPASILFALVALGGAIVGAAGTAFVDARRGLGAALVSATPGVALIFAQMSGGRLHELEKALVGTLLIVGAALVFWPARRT